ncbi:hypothetical protein [Pseudofrankia inefficax]|uniref:Uncharacterized protein n=1 Tax=Pseudofrankia inefficax (strain DSM 45817 / CECT 9037 / DDB 130130 / EuI1c) TaxID=298654 RepID=E3J575_PSEI1|nr:hypothetical protein [Pseudofrankia inefficax]ADP80673.1 hypothetical protein FraEuI1c_2640 [Pseudofrankia inefficax]
MRARWTVDSGAPQLYLGSGFAGVGAFQLLDGLRGGEASTGWLGSAAGALLFGVFLVVDGLPRAWRRRRFETVATALVAGRVVTAPGRVVLSTVLDRVMAGVGYGAVLAGGAYLLHAFSLFPDLCVAAIPVLQYLTSGDRVAELARTADLADE